MHEKLSQSASKLIKSLQQKKYRDLHGLFVVEGIKLVAEALAANVDISHVVYTGNSDDFSFPLPNNASSTSDRELLAISSLKTPNRILAICRKAEQENNPNVAGPTFALDSVADPGNLGTIIRLCDWFGMPQLICDKRSVDRYNPKVVQATMGSIFRVQLHYVDLEHWLAKLAKDQDVFAAHMQGEPLYETHFGEKPVVVLGSEAHGIRPEIEALCKKRISIPRIGNGESLNVAVSGAIIASEIARKSLT